MSDKTIKHFVFSRFFTLQRADYPHNVLDVDFLLKQLPLAKNMLRSLENQTNKNFEMIFLVNPKFFEEPKYEFIFSTLQGYTTLPLRFVKFNRDTIFYRNKEGAWDFYIDNQNTEYIDILKAARDDYDFVITTKIDFDDFIFKDAVADTQNKINQCDTLFAYGYNRGYEYIYGELYPFCYTWNGEGHHSIFQSLILSSSFAKKIPCLLVYDFWHNRIIPQLKVFLEKYNVNFSENMVLLNTSTNAFIYFRHDFSTEHKKSKKVKLHIPEKKFLTTADITKKQLKEEFGFFYELNSIKDYDYLITKKQLEEDFEAFYALNYSLK